MRVADYARIADLAGELPIGFDNHCCTEEGAPVGPRTSVPIAKLGGVSAVPGSSYYCELTHFVRLKFSCLIFCALQVFVLELISTICFFASF